MKTPNQLPIYRWPSLAVVTRQYLVQDDKGRWGIGVVDERHNIIWARPIGQSAQMSAPAGMGGLPRNAILITATAWHACPDDDTYKGWWSDDNVPTGIKMPPEMIRSIKIVDDLGWIMPDDWADQALAGSDDAGHWNYGAKLGKIGGEPPVKGQKNNEINVAQAEEYALAVGEKATARGIRHAAAAGHIPGARKVGRDWLIPYEGFNHYLDHRPRHGRKIRSI
jgi:hypothetical protein